jgi:RHS repeat-associated protein
VHCHRNSETNGLYYFRARHYSPGIGRFLQTDPIGRKGGINLYAYVGNDPLNLVDATGRSADSPTSGVGLTSTTPGSIGTSAEQLGSSEETETEEDETPASFVFRGVETSPDVVFNQGFAPQGTSMNLLAHALDSSNPPSGYISTSISAQIASSFGSNVYVIQTPTNAINVNAALGSASPFPDELEMAVPEPIAGSQIRAVTIFSQGISILNPGYLQ